MVTELPSAAPAPYREYCERGLQAVAIPHLAPISALRDELARRAAELVGQPSGETQQMLDRFDSHLADPSHLNAHRVALIDFLNDGPRHRLAIYEAFRPILDELVGPDIAMQRRINLVIQLPNHEAEELHIHSDAEGGNSPFEVTLWIPLVDVAQTKSMYILDRAVARSVLDAMKRYGAADLRELVNKLVRPEHYVEMRYGNALLFNPSLLHGNAVNRTTTTRWTLNVRVKSLFAPYGAKSFLEYFDPIRLSPASLLGLTLERDRPR